MKFRPALLLGGVVLITAIPVCADTIFYAASTNEPSQPESSALTIRTSHSKFITPAAAQFISEPLPATTPAWTFALSEATSAENFTQTELSGHDNRTFALALADPQNDARPSDSAPAQFSSNAFQPGGALGSRGSENSMVLSTLVPTESRPSLHFASPAEFSPSEPTPSDFSIAGSRFGFFGNDPDHGRGGTGRNKNKNQDGPPVNVPEPGALSLLTLGLLTVAFVARRNREFPTNA